MEQVENKNVLVINISREDLYQLHLCVLNRLGSAHQAYANAYNEEMQKGMQNLINYLSGLNNNILKILDENAPKEEEPAEHTGHTEPKDIEPVENAKK